MRWKNSDLCACYERQSALNDGGEVFMSNSSVLALINAEERSAVQHHIVWSSAGVY